MELMTSLEAIYNRISAQYESNNDSELNDQKIENFCSSLGSVFGSNSVSGTRGPFHEHTYIGDHKSIKLVEANLGDFQDKEAFLKKIYDQIIEQTK